MSTHMSNFMTTLIELKEPVWLHYGAILWKYRKLPGEPYFTP